MANLHSSSNDGAQHRGGLPPLATQCHYRLPAMSVPLQEAEWRHQIGCLRPESVKRNVRRHRGMPEEQVVGSEEASLQRPSQGPACSPLLSHPVADGHWPPWGGWPLEALGRVAGAMFVGLHFHHLSQGI